MFEADSARLVYDATQVGYYGWWMPLLGGLAGAAISRLLWRHADDWPNPGKRRALSTFLAAFSVIWFLGFTWAVFVPQRHLKSALRRGEYSVREGVVRNLVPGSKTDNFDEEWDLDVNGTLYHYRYNPANTYAGFRHTIPHGGPVREGLRVRVYEVRSPGTTASGTSGLIARLEILPSEP